MLPPEYPVHTMIAQLSFFVCKHAMLLIRFNYQAQLKPNKLYLV
jgi:hypothetical protein